MLAIRQQKRSFIFYKDYFRDFFRQQTERVQDKIVWTLDLISELDKVPESYLKHITGTRGLYEIRVQDGSDIFRIFCFFGKGCVIVLANAFQKKDQKTPRREIQKAQKIKQEYESEKLGNNTR